MAKESILKEIEDFYNSVRYCKGGNNNWSFKRFIRRLENDKRPCSKSAYYDAFASIPRKKLMAWQLYFEKSFNTIELSCDIDKNYCFLLIMEALRVKTDNDLAFLYYCPSEELVLLYDLLGLSKESINNDIIIEIDYLKHGSVRMKIPWIIDGIIESGSSLFSSCNSYREVLEMVCKKLKIVNDDTGEKTRDLEQLLIQNLFDMPSEWLVFSDIQQISNELIRINKNKYKKAIQSVLYVSFFRIEYKKSIKPLHQILHKLFPSLVDIKY